MLVLFKKKIYIKFPQNYAGIRTHKGYSVGRVHNTTKDYTYATCFDTRTYSCVRSKLERKVIQLR